MSSQYKPWCFVSVHAFEILFQPGVLSGTLSVIVFCTHHNKMNAPVIKAVPENKKKCPAHQRSNGYHLYADDCKTSPIMITNLTLIISAAGVD